MSWKESSERREERANLENRNLRNQNLKSQNSEERMKAWKGTVKSLRIWDSCRSPMP